MQSITRPCVSRMHVHRAVEAAHRRDLVDVRAHRARVGAVVRLRRGDEGAVVRLDRRVRDDAGQDQLAAAARAPVVRLRLADRDLQRRPRRPRCAARRACRPTRRRRTCRRRRSAGRSGGTAQPFASMRARFVARRASAPCPTRTSGRPCRSRSTTRTSATPAASIASNTAAGASRKGVGRNWLSMITAMLALPASSSAKRRAVDRLGERLARRLGRVADGRRLVGVDRGDEVGGRDLERRACRDASSTRRRWRRSRAGPSTRTGSRRGTCRSSALQVCVDLVLEVRRSGCRRSSGRRDGAGRVRSGSRAKNR